LRETDRVKSKGLHHESMRKLAEDGLSSDPSQTTTVNSTILIARAKVQAEVYTEVQSASVLLAVVCLQLLDYILDSAYDEGLVSAFPDSSPSIAQSQKCLTIVMYLSGCSAALRIPLS
jgi:hypothetical protein